MAFNCNLLLHSLSAIARETKAAENQTPVIIWDIPGVDPLRGRNPDPVPGPDPGPGPQQIILNIPRPDRD
jgi:hypothetical protein